jgi:hypothetical protein
MPLAPANDQVLLLLPGKPDGLIWHFGLSGFPVLLVADVPIEVVSGIVASMAKTMLRS